MSDRHLDEVGKVHIAIECFVIYQGKVLLFKRSETASRFPGWWTIPGGHVDENEDALSAVIREVREETGVLIGEERISLKAVAFGKHIDKEEVWTSFVFRVELSRLQSKDSETTWEGEGTWMEIEEAEKLDNVFPPVRGEFDHVLKDKPGILYTNTTWEKAEMVRINSKIIDIDK